MSKGDTELSAALDRLAGARTEDSIVENLKSIVKAFAPAMYVEAVRQNPFYTSIFEDVRRLVAEDIRQMKDVLRDEIDTIERETGLDDESARRLSNLKVECNMLLDELIRKEREIMAIKI